MLLVHHANKHYCKMVLRRQYGQRPFDETMCNTLIANGGVRKPSEMRQTICDGGDIKHDSDYSYVCDARHTIHSNELFAMSVTTETVSQMKVCVIYGIQFTLMNYLLLGKATETVSQIKVCVIYDIRFSRMNCFRLGKRTYMVQLKVQSNAHQRA